MDTKLTVSRKVLTITWALVLGVVCHQPVALASDAPLNDPNMAANDTDQFAWHLFAAVNQSTVGATNQVRWQTWAEQTVVYGNPCEAPEWPGVDLGEPPGQGSRLVTILKSQGLVEDAFDQLTGECSLQQVKINRPFFNYVVDHDLWYQEGVINQISTDGIDLPTEAVVFKADWKLIEPDQRSKYHWRLVSRTEYENAFGKNSACISDLPETEELLLGLSSFHIVTKALPNWVWTTWNQADTLGRCDYIGCRDDFGSDPATIPPHRQMGESYDPGVLTPEARRLLDEAGLDSVWRHYRLMGTMTSFTDATGRPNLLGNAELEPTFGNTSSCATCHAMATYNAVGTSLEFLKSIQPFEGFVGTPDPSWYFPAQTSFPATPIVYQTDFMWQLATEPKSRADCCSATGQLEQSCRN